MKRPSPLTSRSTLFYRGDYPEFLALTVDKPGGLPAASNVLLPLVIGALTFVGRLVEAEGLFASRGPVMSTSESVAARFFLGVGFCRHSDYARARNYFGQNARALRSGSPEIDRFFAYQGLAFYRYFCGRFRDALRLATSSLAAAVGSDFLYGKAFAYDLVGHCLVQTGDVPAGLEHLGQALQLAQTVGNGGLAKGFRVALACYRAQFGGCFKEAVDELLGLAEDDHFSDSYSKAALLLELGRQYSLRGDLASAKKTLDRASLPIHSARHRRYGALLGLRYGVFYSESEEPHQALHLVRSSLGELDPTVDLALETELRGMEVRLLRELGQDVSPVLLARLRWLTERTGRAVAARVLSREKPGEAGPGQLAKDRMGDLVDRVRQEGKGAAAPILESGYHGLLRQALSIPAGRSGADFDLLAGGVVIYERGRIRYHEGRPPKLIAALAHELATGETSKEDLVSRVWGYRYHPLRHDATLYRAISRLRELLEPGWIEATAMGYRLRPGVELRFGPEALPTSSNKSKTKAVRVPAVDLNWRQVQIIRAMSSREVIDVEDCRQLFRVSEVTARRDLAELVRLAMMARLGKGRATKYTLVEAR